MICRDNPFGRRNREARRFGRSELQWICPLAVSKGRMEGVQVKSKFRLAKSAMLITVITALSFIAGLVFHILLARSFGAKWGLDAFVGASTFPFLFVSVIGALVEKTFVPFSFELRAQHD